MPFLKLIRVHDWVKSLFVLIGPIYGKYWSILLNQVLIAALAFSFTASAVYVFNDWYDLNADKLHPLKAGRPLVQGSVSVMQAMLIMLLCLIMGFSLAWSLSQTIVCLLFIYVAINLFYNLYGKQIPYVDVICIASGFMLRILAGTIGIGIVVSKWLLLCGTLVSLNLALAKRYLELRFVETTGTRKVLSRYSLSGLLISLRFAATSIVLSYVFYCLSVIKIYAISPWIVATLPSAVFAYVRFDYLLRQVVTNDNPVNVLIQDKYFALNAGLFVLITVIVLL